MDPVIAQSIAALISAMATVALMAGTYYFGTVRREEKRMKKEEEADESTA
jgi:preprotein translocase subunit YajC